MNTNLYRITQKKQKISTQYPQNTVRKNYFLSACQEIDDSVSLDEVDEDCVYGGIIGIGNSKLDYFLSVFKILRLHAVHHDASGYMKTLRDRKRLLLCTTASRLFKLLLFRERDRTGLLFVH